MRTLLKFVATTDSDHDFVVYPNLAEHVIVNVNQLWVADITYVRLLARPDGEYPATTINSALSCSYSTSRK